MMKAKLSYDELFTENQNLKKVLSEISVINLTEKGKVEANQEQNGDHLKFLVDLYQMENTNPLEIFDFALEKSLKLCNSKIGFFGFLNQQETIVTIHAWSSSAMKSCEVKDKYIEFEVSKTGIWGEVIRQRKSLVINNYKEDNPLKRGTPHGHIELFNFLGVPIFDKEKIVALIAVGNKDCDYNETDKQGLTLLMDGLWKIVKQRNFEKELIVSKERAEESEKKFRILFETMPIGITLADQNGQILTSNPAAERILGLTKKEQLQRSIDGVEWSIIRPDGTLMQPEEYASVRALKEQRPIMNIEMGVTKKINEVAWINVNAAPIKDYGVVISYEDITERKLAEQELVKAKEKAEESEQNLQVKNEEYEALNEELRQTNEELLQINQELEETKEKAEESDRLKTAFLHNISHEVRTPMNAICGFAGLLNDPDLSNEQREEFTTIIQNSSNQLLSIVTDIVTISTIESKQEKLNLKKTCINIVLSELQAIFKSLALNKNVSLRINQQLPDLQSVVYTDKTKISQILTNLLANAIKFTNEGFVEFGYVLKGTQLEFYVKDTGIGIRQEMHGKIFERFRQADETIHVNYGGTGLGLSIVKGYVELLGGKIWVQSEPDKGSTFYFTIPYKPTNEIVETEKTIQFVKSLNYRTILVAEDEEYNYRFIVEILKDLNLKIMHAKDGRETVEICKTNPNIDLILMDIKMPIMSGHEAAKIIREINPNLPIVAQSAYALGHERARYEGIFDDYLTKPINKSDLKQMVVKYID